MEKLFYRKCPCCNKEIEHKSEKSLKHSIRHNLICKSCKGLIKAKEPNQRGANLNILLEDSYISFYWIGFLLADGSFSNNRLKLALTSKDINHLRLFAQFINYKRDVSQYNSYCSVSAKNLEIIPIICEKFNIKSRKTYNPPLTIKKFPLDLQYCLLAGFIDGDGNIKNQYKRKDFILYIKNHKSWINILKEFNELIDGTNNFVRINNEGYASLIISNSEILKELKKKILLYNIPIMKRKWDIINLNFTTRNIKANELKNKILDDFINGLSVTESSIKNNTSYENAYRIKRKYFKK